MRRGASEARRTIAYRWLLLLVGSCALSACDRPAETAQPPRLVVLYATCTLNKDFLSPYDPEIPFTPALERFASQGVVFERHHTESGQSGVAYASLFSGSQADRHGVLHHPSVLSRELDLVTEVFAANGYEVHSWLAHGMASAELGYAQGVPPANQHPHPLHARDPQLRAVLGRLESDPDARAFLVTNFTLTHAPYPATGLGRLCAEHPTRCEMMRDPGFERLREIYRANHIALAFDPEPTLERLGLDASEVRRLREVTRLLYEASVVGLDEQFGELVAAIDSRGLTDQSLLAFTADHGEVPFRENADFHWTHGFQLAPEVLNVPWLIRGPGLRPGRYAPVTRSIDVLPTLAGLVGASAGSTSQGVDLSPALRGDAPPPELLAFSHTALFPRVWWQQYGDLPTVRRLFPGWGARWMAVGVRDQDDFHEIRHRGDGHWERAAYDLSQGPGERRNLFDPDDPQHAAMAERLRLYQERMAEVADTDPEPVPEKRQTELLRSLGYIE